MPSTTPEKPNALPLLISCKVIASLAAVSLMSVRRWDKQRLIPGRVVLPGSKLVRFDRDQVLTWLKSLPPE